MSAVAAQTRRRWLVVAAVVAALCVLPSIIAAIPAGSARIPLSTLAERIAASARQPYQGYAVATGSLGLPSLPDLAEVASLFDGDTSLRIWYASPQRWRVDTLDADGERDLYQGSYQGRSAQTIWDSGQSQLTTVVGATPARLPRGADLAPPDLARRLLAAAGTASMTGLPARRIGGISAAGLRLTPSTSQTTIGYVDIWADPRTGLPVEVAVTPAGGPKPLLMSRMLEVSTTAPAAATTAIPRASANVGANVTANSDVYAALLNLRLGPLPATLVGLPRVGRGLGPLPGIAAYGDGFEQVEAVSVPGRLGFEAFDAARAVGTQTATSGGQAVVASTPLLNVLVVRVFGGRDAVIVAGMVVPDVLTQAATQLIEYESQLR